MDARRDGDNPSELNDAIYQQLKTLARGLMISERSAHTLSPTDLVHEAYLKLSRAELSFRDERHYFRTLARQMRRLLVDYGRHKAAQKNDGQKIHFTDSLGLSNSTPDFSSLSEAIDALREMDERSAEIVEMVYFAALPQARAAQMMAVSVATLERDLKFGRAFINDFILNRPQSDD